MQNISTYETDERSPKPKRTSSSSSSSTLLPQGKKAENLRTCDLKQVKEKIEQCAKDKADQCIIALRSTHDFIAAKKTSVSSTSSGKCQETDDYKHVELEAFKICVECCFNTIN